MFSVPNIVPAACLLICGGSDCRKKQKKAYNALVRSVSDAGLATEEVKCQGSCVGPTAVIVDKSGPRWFEDLRSVKAQADVVTAATRVTLGGKTKPTKRLQSRELTGKKRKKAAKRLERLAS